jgi:hypothetical protein
VDDSVLRSFVHNQSRANAAIAQSLGGRSERTADVFLSDSGSPVPYFNQAVLARPVIDAADPVLDVVEAWYGDADHPVTMLSIWPTPDLTARGWSLVGHPMVVVRGPHHPSHEPAEGVTVSIASTPDDFAAAERVAVEGYPIDEGIGLSAGRILSPRLADTGMIVRVGSLRGEPAGVGLDFVAEGVVNLCLGATLASARRRGVWEALVWARLADAPELPAVAYTSDYSRPGFVRMGFLPIMRFTLWAR